MTDISIILANSASAQIYRYNSSGKTLELIKELSHPRATYKTSELMADEAGRYQKSAGPNQGAYEPHTPPKEVEAGKFAAKLSDALDDLSSTMNKITIFAPGPFQAKLKNKLAQPLLEKITAFIDKDYTKLPINDLKKQLNKELNLRF